jgi:hypothetical protein
MTIEHHVVPFEALVDVGQLLLRSPPHYVVVADQTLHPEAVWSLDASTKREGTRSSAPGVAARVW